MRRNSPDSEERIELFQYTVGRGGAPAVYDLVVDAITRALRESRGRGRAEELRDAKAISEGLSATSRKYGTGW